MTINDWDRIEPLLGQLIELEESARDGFLRRECAGEPELAQRLQELLDEELGPDPFLVRPDPVQPADRQGQLIGRYRLLRPLGRGGMGEVWLAERADGEFEQQVALKLIHGGLHTEELLRRFRAERQILAWLEHPGIARLVDGGVSEDRRPYLVMEYVDGEPIVSYAESLELPLRARLELFVATCEAVQHAHERGIVHRDLKPANVLVDAAGQPKLLDFGIAKVLGAEDASEQVELTRTGQRLFSPLYASPEQVRGEPVTAASDVYSLGLLLCELLTGQRPYDARTTSQLELERVVCEARPRRPSELATAEVRRALRGDLDWIVGLALRKEHRRRYASARALSDDVVRHLADHPVLARPDSLAYRAHTFARRNRALVGGTLGIFLALTAGIIASVLLWRAATESKREAHWSAYASVLQSAETALRGGNVGTARAQLENAPRDLRGWEWRHLLARLDRSLGVTPLEPYPPRRIAISPAGDSLAARGDGVVQLHDLDDAQVLQEVAISKTPRDNDFDFAPWSTLDFHPGGEVLATGGLDGRVRVLDARELTVIHEVDLGAGHVYSAAYDASGRWLACGLRSGEVVCLEHPSYHERARWQAHKRGDLNLEFSADGRWLASASWDDLIRLWSVPDFEQAAELVGHERHVTDVVFAADDSLLVSTSIDGTARVWTIGEPARPLIFHAHGASVESVAMHPDGRTAFTGAADGTILRWDLLSGRVEAELRGHQAKVQDMAVTSGGDRLISSDGQTIRSWDIDTQDVPTLVGCEYQRQLVLHPQDEELAVAGPDGVVRRWSLPDHEPLDALVLEGYGHSPLAYLGGRLITTDPSAKLRTWSLSDARVEGERAAPPGLTMGYGFDAREGALHVVMRDGLLVRQTVDGTTELQGAPLPENAMGWMPGYAVSLPTDGRGRLLFGGVSGTIWRIDPAAGEVHPILPGESGAQVLASRNDELLVATGGEVSLWRDADLQWKLDLGEVSDSATFHPTEPRVALGSESGLVRLIDMQSGRLLVSLDGHTGAVGTVRFSLDGGSLFSCSTDGTVRIWTAPPVQE